MSENQRKFHALRHECVLALDDEELNDYDKFSEEYLFLMEIDGVMCKVEVAEDYNSDMSDYHICIRGREDITSDAKVHVYDNVLWQVREKLQGIVNHLERASIRQREGEEARWEFQAAERLGRDVAKLLDKSSGDELEELLGEVKGSRLYYAGGLVKSRTYGARWDKMPIADVRQFMQELLADIALPSFPTPPPFHQWQQFIVYNWNLFGDVVSKTLSKQGAASLTSEMLAGHFERQEHAMDCADNHVRETGETYVVYDLVNAKVIVKLGYPDVDDTPVNLSQDSPIDYAEGIMRLRKPKSETPLFPENDSIEEDSPIGESQADEIVKLKAKLVEARQEVETVKRNARLETWEWATDRDEWQAKYNTMVAALDGEQRRHANTRQSLQGLQEAYAASKTENTKLSHQRHKMAIQIHRSKHRNW